MPPAGRRGSVRANFAYLAVGEVANKAFRFIAAVLLARSLTVEEFGLLNVLIAASGIALVASSLGLPDVGARDVAASRDDAGEIAGRVLVLRAVTLSVVVAGSLAAGAYLWPGNVDLLAAAGLMAFFMAVSADWLARGLERMWVVALAAVVGGAALLAGAVLVAAAAPNVLTALAVFAAGEAVVAGVCWLGVRRLVRPRLTLAGTAPLVRRAWPVAASAFIIYAYYANFDTIVLGVTRSVEEAGLYSGAYRLFLAFSAVPVFAAYALLPSLTRGALARADGVADAGLTRVLAVLAVFGVAVLGVVEMAGDIVLRALFGAEFGASDSALVLLFAALAWFAVGFPAGYSLVAKDDNRSYLVGAAVAGAANLALNLALIPPFGMVGAGFATLISFVAASLVWLRRRGLLGGALAPAIAGILAVSAAAVATVEWESLRLAVGVATLAVAGVGACLVLAQARGVLESPA